MTHPPREWRAAKGWGQALIVAALWGALENFGLAPHVDAWWLAALWFGGLGLGPCLNKIMIGHTA